MLSNPLVAAGLFAVGGAAISRRRTIDRSAVELVHAPQTAAVGSGGDSLRDLVATSCPSLCGRFVPAAALPTADLQTCYNGARERLARLALVEYERELIATADGGTIGLDWSPPFARMPEGARPVVVLLHGLSGGSQEAYVQLTARHLTAAPYRFRAVVVNYRGCAGVPLTTHTLYNGGHTGDYGAAVAHIQRRLPGAPLIGVGYSLGANVLTKYVGEQGAACPLRAAVSVCNPYDLEASSRAIERPTLRNRYLYEPAMLFGLLRLVRRHRKMMDTGPVRLDHDALAKATTIREFDELVTARAFGYKSSTDYYTQNSSAQFLPRIRIPFLAISALDDPVCPPEAIPRDAFLANPHLVLAATQFGGHLGFHESLSETWLPRPIGEFCAAVFERSP
ncbi:hypothetical protein H4R18_003572 [Coemansia javaensis]|uniref:AB hydrolase-1 domain-containing protein n=1 Tax=Coemansia javaensis TaxID=2761396 RepID=A0A9W8LG39_9FUNG|nr:hypothetical protein H4R18_003572 [Coemansia javaensis]